MIKEALQYIVGMGSANIIKNDQGRQFSDKQLYNINTPKIEGFNTSTLTSIVDYIRKQPDGFMERFSYEKKMIIHIESENKVSLKTDIIRLENTRDTIIEAKAILPKIEFGRFIQVEEFIIQMQSKFVETQMSLALMSLVGNVKEERVKNTSDDGFSQSVVAKAGIVKVEEVVVPNPVNLMPYRTFQEVNQPESLFVFRMQDGPTMALFEADGGIWRNEAIRNIRKYFEAELRDLIEDNSVVIIG